MNIFECFWVRHDKELVTKLSSTSCRLDIIIDAYRTGSREINFMLLQFHWFKFKLHEGPLPWGKNVHVFMDNWNCLCSLKVGGCVITAQDEISLAQCPVVSLSDFSLLQFSWTYAFSPALCFTSCTPTACYRLKQFLCPTQNKNNTAHVDFSVL